MGLLLRSPIVSITLAPLCVGYRVGDKPPAFRRGYLTGELYGSTIGGHWFPGTAGAIQAHYTGTLYLGDNLCSGLCRDSVPAAD